MIHELACARAFLLAEAEHRLTTYQLVLSSQKAEVFPADFTGQLYKIHSAVFSPKRLSIRVLIKMLVMQPPKDLS